MQRIQVKQQIKTVKNTNKQVLFLDQVKLTAQQSNNMCQINLMPSLISKLVGSTSIEGIASLMIAPSGSRVCSKTFSPPRHPKKCLKKTPTLTSPSRNICHQYQNRKHQFQQIPTFLLAQKEVSL